MYTMNETKTEDHKVVGQILCSYFIKYHISLEIKYQIGERKYKPVRTMPLET